MSRIVKNNKSTEKQHLKKPNILNTDDLNDQVANQCRFLNNALFLLHLLFIHKFIFENISLLPLSLFLHLSSSSY